MVEAERLNPILVVSHFRVPASDLFSKARRTFREWLNKLVLLGESP